MARIGLNVPAGLTVTTACCAAYNELGEDASLDAGIVNTYQITVLLRD